MNPPHQTRASNRLRLAVLFVSLAVQPIPSGAAEHGVLDKEVKIGMSNAQSGNAADLGMGVKAGAVAYFDKLNAAGGVNGRKVNLIACDDGYEPARCSGNTRKLLEQDDVFALFGYVGTPTSAAILPLLAKSDVPYFAPFTGAASLREPIKKNVFNIRAGYFDETEGLVERLTADLGIKSVGLFVQEDAYGSAGEAGVSRALAKRGLAVTARGAYARNSVEVDSAVDVLMKARPQAVVMIGTYKACAVFARKCRANGFAPVFCNISFVGTASFIKEAGANGEGVYVSQVTPSPFDASIDIVRQYQADMKTAGRTDFDYTSLEGYIDAVVFSKALQKAGPDLTRAGFSAAMESLNEDLGGFEVVVSSTSHQASRRVYFTRIQQGKPVPVTKFSPQSGVAANESN